MQSKFRQQAEYAKKLSPEDRRQYQDASSGEVIQVQVGSHKVSIRKDTPDVVVAISCLSGEFEAVRFLLPSDYTGTIVDAGGYIGTASLALSDLFPLARIICVEPSLDNLNVLKQNIAGRKNIEAVFGALVGGAQKTIELKNRGTGEWGFTAVQQPKDRPDAETMHEVPALRLSDLVENTTEIGLLKLDIEGGELELIQEDAENLGKIPNIFAELHNRIARGCRAAFFSFSKDRIVVRADGEKYLSISREIPPHLKMVSKPSTK